MGLWKSAIKELQRLKEAEFKQLGWDIKRNLAKITDTCRSGKLDQALIAPGDGKRLKAVLPQSEIEYHEANAEHAKQLPTAAA